MIWGSPPMKAFISDPISLFYSDRLGVCIPPGQGIVGQGTSSKCHSVFLGIIAMRKYFTHDIKTEHNRTSRNYDNGGSVDVLPIFSMLGHQVGATEIKVPDLEILSKAHSYVLFNYSKVDEFINEHLMSIRDNNHQISEHALQRLHSETFTEWFQDHRKDLESKRKTQNSRVMLEAVTNSFSSSKDNNPIMGDVTYYGVINDIIELEFSADKKVVLFDCDWISNDPVDKGWKVVIKTTAMDSFDMTEQTCNDDVETYLQRNTSSGPRHNESIDISLIREGVSGTTVDENTLFIDGDENQF
ncbi:hypothetical protein Tco_1073717 [Tanacetum coccineum]